jgi:DNA polymerase III delta prime subunit
MTRSLIVKYLPRTFEYFELEPNIINLLRNAIKFDTLNILIISNPGCGKTSLINVVVDEYFKKHPKAEANILRISSTKEQGIAYYRGDVRTFCQSLSSIPNRKKVVILDDLDLISEQSQQVFRNCIDKYYKNVHFIASCTNAQKVIKAVSSAFRFHLLADHRCQTS